MSSVNVRKKILFITGSHTLSGSEIANINVAEVLKKNGATIFYLVPPWSEEKIGEYIRSKNINTISYRIRTKVYDWKYAFQSFFLTFWDSYNLMRINKKYGINSIHLSSEHYARIFILYIIFSKKEIIYRVGDSPNIHRLIFRWMWERLLIRKVKHFVCVSQYIAGKLKLLGCPEEKIQVIYSYPFKRGSLRKAIIPAEINKDNRVICYAGQIAKHKGVDIMVEAAIRLCRTIDPIIFLIAGDVDYNPDFSLQIKGKIERLGLKERIQVIGFVEDIFNFFKQSDIHLCPSVFEDPLPNVIIEAKAAGIPTVGFRSGGIPELIHHRVDGYLCKEKNIDSLLEGIRFFMDKSILEMAKISAKKSLDRIGLSRENFERQWTTIYG